MVVDFGSRNPPSVSLCPGVGGTLHKSLELLGSCWRGKPPTMPLGVARLVFTLAIGLIC